MYLDLFKLPSCHFNIIKNIILINYHFIKKKISNSNKKEKFKKALKEDQVALL